MIRFLMRPEWSRVVPVFVLALILLLSVAASLIIAALVRAQQQGRFEREAQVTAYALRDRMGDYERLLHSARATWQLHPDLLREQPFAAFGEEIQLMKRYPGVQALGFATWVENGDTAALVAKLRQTVKPDYAVRQGNSPQIPKAPISVIAPFTPQNSSALGFDLYSESLRREAMQKALENQQVQVTRRLLLVQKDAQGQPLPGFLLMLPVWKTTPEKQLQGFIYAAVRADEFLSGLGNKNLFGQLLIEAKLAGESLTNQQFPAQLSFKETIPLEMAGQTWTLNYGANSIFGQDFAANVPILTLLYGLLVAGLAYLVTQAQVNALGRAEQLNQSLRQVRGSEQQAKAEFEAIFQAMQDAAAFTDATGKVRLINHALAQQFKLEPAQIIGQSLGSLHLDDHLESRPAFQALTTVYRRTDGTVFSGEAQRSEVYDPQGERLGLLEVVRDVSERVEAERAVQAGERRYRAVLDAIPHVLQVSDPSGQVTFTNDQHQQLLGNDDLKSHLTPADRAVYDQLWRQALESQDRVQGELQLGLNDNQRRWFMFRIAPMRGAQGKVSEWVTIATDIHDRFLAERLAQRNEERSRGVLEGLPQIVWLTDAQGQALYFNRRWDEYVGAERAGYGFLNLLHPDDRAVYRQRWDAAVKAARPFEAEHRLLAENGTYRAFVTRGLPVLDAQGQVIEWVGTSTDVDDSVFAENSARLLADVTEQLSARTEAPTTGRDSHYHAALKKLTARFVDSAALWTVHPVRLAASSFYSSAWEAPHMRVAVEQAVKRVLEHEDPIFMRSHPLLHSVNASGALLYPLLSRSGELCGVLGLAYRHALTDRDQDLAQELSKRFASAVENNALQAQITAAQQDLQTLNQSLEDRVIRRTQELENANRELEAFSYSVSHDLRTPLRHIVGFGDLLGKESGGHLSSKGQRYLGIITDSASRMSQLIDDLLAFSRMGRQELSHLPVNLRDLIGASWTSLEPDRQGREIHFAISDFEGGGEWPTIQGDPAMLGQVFTNLLSNAIKYTRTREQASIQVTAQRSGPDIIVAVRDNGVGFDPKYTDKLFGVFQRLHRADEFEGIGIGLANVRRIVSRHGGQVTADAALGEGAIFKVTLPLEGMG